ncbi:hypothetical protein T484DRAFT_3545396 [Baffinella frigidus]|nr:hypothetical protein T484DRAFT_3545396 [Cryptophyta sp. CCMP2293]
MAAGRRTVVSDAGWLPSGLLLALVTTHGSLLLLTAHGAHVVAHLRTRHPDLAGLRPRVPSAGPCLQTTSHYWDGSLFSPPSSTTGHTTPEC